MTRHAAENADSAESPQAGAFGTILSKSTGAAFAKGSTRFQLGGSAQLDGYNRARHDYEFASRRRTELIPGARALRARVRRLDSPAEKREHEHKQREQTSSRCYLQIQEEAPLTPLPVQNLSAKIPPLRLPWLRVPGS